MRQKIETEETMATPNDSALVKVANWLTNAAVNGIGPLSSSTDLAQEYRIDKSYPDNDARVKSLIKWEAAKNFSTGFLTGLGGFVTLPVTIPAGMGAAWAVQARMVGAIAEIYGHSVNESRVQTMILLCLIGSDGAAILRQCGVKLGRKVSEKLIDKIPGKILIEINKMVGFRLITKSGTKGVINLTKCVPIVGGVVSGTVDAVSCRVVGKYAIKMFKP
jgi:uncharacterized protein (DUF697 family)